MYLASVRLIMRGRANGMLSRGSRLLLFFSTGQLLLITVLVGSQAALGQAMWIAPPIEGSTGGQEYDSLPMWYQNVGSAANFVLNLMSDALLVSPYAALQFVTQSYSTL